MLLNFMIHFPDDTPLRSLRVYGQPMYPSSDVIGPADAAMTRGG